MLVYPQLSQFPIRKKKRLRTVVNQMADGRTISLTDPSGAVTEWNLTYRDLTDDDAAALSQFFLAAEGTLNGFTFLDPTANLLSWSEKLDHSGWTRGPLLTVAGRSVVNGGGAPQSITQTLPAPSGYVYCLSASLRSEAPVTVTMLAGGHRSARALTTSWSRVAFAATGDPIFGLELPAGASIEVNGMQVEAQTGASMYRPSTVGGIIAEARFRDDFLAITATGVNRHAATVNIIHANHL
jgi:hypothetical protein